MTGGERPGRDPFIDVLRIAAVVIVVLGHWLVTSVYWDEAGTRSVNALSVQAWIRASTWITQVMPLLFFVGGFANATVSERFDGEYLGYLRERLVRLVTPVAALFALWAPVGVAVAVFDLPQILAHSAFVAGIPMWFLGIYMIVVALAPALLRLHRRFGLAVPLWMVAGAVAVDIALHRYGIEGVAFLNYAFVWLLAHQLGFWYRDGRLATPATPWLMAASGLVGLVALTTVGGYPVSMVGVPGEPRWNTDPPSLAIVALILWSIGLALIVRPAVERWGRNRSRLVSSLNRRILTIYVWHITAIPIAVLALYPLGFPQHETGSAAWWRWRPLWLVGLAMSLALLVALLGRSETRARPRPPVTTTPARVVGASLAVFSIAAAVLGSALTGFSDPFGAGRALLVFTLNPTSNLLHMVLGIAAAAAAVRPGGAGVAVPSLVAAAFIGAGWAEVAAPGTLSLLAWNQATAILHVVAGGFALVALAVAAPRRGPREQNAR
jgi:surface polysaccharide O-acyltransferase-like enzyme